MEISMTFLFSTFLSVHNFLPSYILLILLIYALKKESANEALKFIELINDGDKI